jgi:predicted nuclease of restriction endonuclease-like (RecB) superfamily
LPTPQSDLAQDITKDPYNFDFSLSATTPMSVIWSAVLLDHLRQFLLELGVGFALVGSQYRLTVGNEEFYIGLLFYHLKLRAYIVVDLKMQAFRPEFAGKMNFYLSAVNALRDINKPIGISEYRLVESLPEKLQGSLPTIE